MISDARKGHAYSLISAWSVHRRSTAFIVFYKRGYLGRGLNPRPSPSLCTYEYIIYCTKGEHSDMVEALNTKVKTRGNCQKVDPERGVCSKSTLIAITFSKACYLEFLFSDTSTLDRKRRG